MLFTPPGLSNLLLILDNNPMNKKTSFIVVVVALLVIAVAIIIWLCVSLQQAQKEAAQAVQAVETQKQIEIAAQQAAEAQKEKDLEAELMITWPSRGSQLCYEQQYSISWQAPADMDTVTATLYTPSSTTRLGDYPAVNGMSGNVGFGSSPWYLTDASGAVVPTSQAYKIKLSGMYHGHEISTSTDGVFSIGKCQS